MSTTLTSALEILRKLVSIPSVSSMSNLALLEAIASLLEPHGWLTIRQNYTTSDGQQKANMLAVPKQFKDTLPHVDLLFVCHTDTVPYQANWADATNLREAGEYLHGCGSCDVKGSLAGLLAAALETDSSALQTSVAYAFTAEEEIGCIGASKLASSELIHPKRVIVCEPTSLHPATAGKGYGLAEVTVRGHEAHSAFPAKGISAINVAAHLITSLEQAQAASAATDKLFTPPHTTFNVGTIRGGSAKNILAGQCNFLVEWRPIPGEAPVHGAEVLKQLAAETATKYNCTIEVNVKRADAGFRNPASSQLGPALEQMLARPQTGISFGSEATRFAALAEEAIVIGPGDMETAHSERECIPIAELEEWTAIVRKLLLHGVPQA